MVKQEVTANLTFNPDSAKARSRLILRYAPRRD